MCPALRRAGITYVSLPLAPTTSSTSSPSLRYCVNLSIIVVPLPVLLAMSGLQCVFVRLFLGLRLRDPSFAVGLEQCEAVDCSRPALLL